MATARQCAEAGEEIGRHEQRSPQFVLPHVRALVRARRLQRPGVPPDHDMSQRDGVGTASQRSQLCKRPTKQRAVRFNNAVDQRGLSPPEQCECEYEAEQCCRASPEISQKPDHGSIVTYLAAMQTKRALLRNLTLPVVLLRPRCPARQPDLSKFVPRVHGFELPAGPAFPVSEHRRQVDRP